MNVKFQTRTSFKPIGRLLAILVVFCIILLLTASIVRGRGFGLWRIVHLGKAVLNSRSVSSHNQGNFRNVVFLHHSTGRNLIDQGSVREKFTATGYDFWDHDYNYVGLRRPDGSTAGYSYYVPNDNTDPDGLVDMFTQPVYVLPLNAFSGFLQHEVIIFKSCFPVSHIISDEQLEEYESHYRVMRNVMDKHPDKVFIVVTPPPLNPLVTDTEAASRARAFADWLKSDEYLMGHPNIFTFDFFTYLAENDPSSPEFNMLRKAYRQEGADSHPNQKANTDIGPLLVDFVIDATRHLSTDSRN